MSVCIRTSIRLRCKISPGSLFFLLLLCLLLSACGSFKIPTHRTQILIRDVQQGQPLAGVVIRLQDPQGVLLSPELKTDPLGYAELNWKKGVAGLPKRPDLSGYAFICTIEADDPDGHHVIQDTFYLSKYLPFLDLYMDRRRIPAQALPVSLSHRVADMHYHVSMRTHNLFGDHLYENEEAISHIPENINLYKTFRKLKVLYQGRWRKPYLGTINYDKVGSSPKWTRRRDKMAALLQHESVRPKGGQNQLTQYTQATHPHLMEGHVYLAFNAISPFEHNVSNTPQKRFVNRNFVTAAPKKWLHRIGWKTDTLTHWENFNHEYRTSISQRIYENQHPWRFFEHDTDLHDPIPTIVQVVEGSHVLQDRFFPHTILYDLARRDQDDDRHLLNHFIHQGAWQAGHPVKTRYQAIIAPLYTTLDPAAQEIADKLALPQPTPLRGNAWAALGYEVQQKIQSLLDSLMLEELTQNIDSLKRLDGPPIAMMTIAHLAFNGMMGHAPNLDGGKFPNNLIAQKNYNIRVSDDPTYKSQWASAFFTIPGINKFGKTLVDRLIATDNGHRIHIDLKHSDFSTRKYFFEEVMIDTIIPKTMTAEDTLLSIPPICSHCAVTGLPAPYYSPFNDEYSLSRSPSTTTFYPFGINLYDEEIKIICQNDGIIGIPLEQRVLGGYINNKRTRRYRINAKGDLQSEKRTSVRRWREIKRLFRYHFLHTNLLDEAMAYTQDSMQVPLLAREDSLGRYRRILNITCEDYISAEPFIQNLFHIIDQSGLSPSQAWSRICIGSDLDGLIDPIDICPTASHYANFRSRLRQFIPIYLDIRALHNTNGPIRGYHDYFSAGFSIEDALDQLFYKSLRDFTTKYFTLANQALVAKPNNHE